MAEGFALCLRAVMTTSATAIDASVIEASHSELERICTAVAKTTVRSSLDMGRRLGGRHHAFKTLPGMAGRARCGRRRVIHVPYAERCAADVASVAGRALIDNNMRPGVLYDDRGCL